MRQEQENQILTVQRVESPTLALDTLRIRGEIYVPNYQRESFNTTIRRMGNISAKRFTCKRQNNEFFTVKRVR